MDDDNGSPHDDDEMAERADLLRRQADELTRDDDLRRASRDDEIDAAVACDERRAMVAPALVTLFAALVAALGELPDIPKSRTATIAPREGRTFAYAYAGLADVFALVRPVFARHGLAVVQLVATDLDTGTVTVATRILHVSGEWYDAGQITYPLPPTVQGLGSLITYLRRYALLAALGIAGADDDDDGRSATDAAQPAPARARARGVAKAQLKRLGAAFDAAGIERDNRHQLVAGIIGRPVASSSELTADEAGVVLDAVQAVIDGAARIEIDPDDTWRVVRTGND